MARISISDAMRLGLDLGASTPSRALSPPRTPKVARTRASDPPATRERDAAPAGRRPGARHAVGCGDPFEVSFFVPGTPCTKQRARTSLPKGRIEHAFAQAKGCPSAFGRLMAEVRHQSFTPTETRRYEALVGRVAAAAMRSRPPYDAPVAMEVTCTFEGAEGTWPTGSGDPDIDNVEKAVMDALKGIVWSDDRLVVAKRSSKSCGVEPGVLVVVRGAALTPSAC